MRGALVAFVLLWTSPGRAESPLELEAKEHYARAQGLYDRAHWSEALTEYQASYALSKYPAILYKIALCEDQLGHAAEAIDAYQRYLDAVPETDRRAGIEQRLIKLRQPAPAERPPVTAPAVTAPAVAAPAVAAPAVTAGPPPLPAVAAPARRTPVYRKWWVWTLCAAGVAAVALGVGLGVGLPPRFSPNLGTFTNGVWQF